MRSVGGKYRVWGLELGGGYAEIHWQQLTVYIIQLMSLQRYIHISEISWRQRSDIPDFGPSSFLSANGCLSGNSQVREDGNHPKMLWICNYQYPCYPKLSGLYIHIKPNSLASIFSAVAKKKAFLSWLIIGKRERFVIGRFLHLRLLMSLYIGTRPFSPPAIFSLKLGAIERLVGCIAWVVLCQDLDSQISYISPFTYITTCIYF